jgi:hypothetical protein
MVSAFPVPRAPSFRAGVSVVAVFRRRPRHYIGRGGYMAGKGALPRPAVRPCRPCH